MIQLNIFEELMERNAYSLLNLLNESRKPREKYHPQHIAYHGRYRVLIACTQNKDAVGNIIDREGNIPEGFCVNWRSLSIIKHELKQLKIT